MIIYSKLDEGIIKTYKCRQKYLGANKRFEDKITLIDIVNLLKRFDFKCVYCAEPLKPSTWQLDHFYAKAGGGKNVIENLATSCKWCNLSKNALDGYAYINKCKKVIENNIFIENGIIPFHECKKISKENGGKNG